MARPLKLSLQALALGAVVGLLALLVWRITHQPHPVKLGGPAPSFSLDRLDGNGKIELAALRGKAVVLNFWASWCGPCKTESQALQKAYLEYRDKGVVVLGVDSEDYAGDGRSFARRYGLSYPLVHESGSSVKERYGVSGYPESFFIDRAGGVVHYVIGPLKPDTIDEFVRKSLRA